MESVGKKRCSIDWDGNRVTLNGKPVGFIFPMRDAKEVVLSVTGYSARSVTAYKEFNETYGITAAKAKKVINGVYYSNVYAPHKKLVDTFCYGYGGKINTRLFRRVMENKRVVEQYEADGLHNLTPFAAYWGKSTKEMRELVGKATWKGLCKNSFTRNLLLAKKAVGGSSGLFPTPSHNAMTYLKALKDVPSTLLRTSHVTHASAALWISNNHPYKSLQELLRQGAAYSRLERLYTDTRRLANALASPFSDKWTLNQMQARHDAYSDELNSRRDKAEKTTYDTLAKIPLREGSLQGYSYKLLSSDYEIKQEGKEMHHCVGIYSDQVAKGKYLVYSVRHPEDKDRRYTLGISVTEYEGIARFKLNQHYRVCNENVSTEESEISERLISELNKEKIKLEESSNV